MDRGNVLSAHHWHVMQVIATLLIFYFLFSSKFLASLLAQILRVSAARCSDQGSSEAGTPCDGAIPRLEQTWDPKPWQFMFRVSARGSDFCIFICPVVCARGLGEYVPSAFKADWRKFLKSSRCIVPVVISTGPSLSFFVFLKNWKRTSSTQCMGGA